MKKLIRENIRLIFGGLFVSVYIYFLVRRLLLFEKFVDRMNESDMPREILSNFVEAGVAIQTFKVVVYSLILVALLFLVYKKK